MRPEPSGEKRVAVEMQVLGRDRRADVRSGIADEIGRLGPYRVLRLLGRGGMGAVFAGEDPLLQRPVALKVMKPSGEADSRRKVSSTHQRVKLSTTHRFRNGDPPAHSSN